MYHNILVPVLLDDGHDTAASFAAARALADEGAKFSVIHVVEPIPAIVATEVPKEVIARNQADSLQKLAGLSKELSGAKAEMVVGHAGRAIIDYAKSHDCDCIIIASHKPGLEDYFLGSTASRVVRHAHCAVHVIR